MSRHDKITEAIRKEISNIIHDELKDPRLGFVTIMRVELADDFRYAKVFFSVLGKEEDYKRTKEALDSAAGFIRRLIAQRIRLRFTPEISFREDRSCEYSIKIQEALEEVKELNKASHSSEEKSGIKKRKEGRSDLKKSRCLRKEK